MIKNRDRALVAIVVGVLSSCAPAERGPEGYQGVIELDERLLSFEVAGRVNRVLVKRGDPVEAKDEIARVDATLEETAKEVRSAEADAARAQVALLKAGARPEEIRALEARVRAVATSEALLSKNLAREKKLLDRGVSSQAAIDEIEAKLNATIADRQSLEQQVKALRRGARKQEIEGATSRAEAADKGLTLQSERIERHVLHAPMEAVVLDVHVEPGEVVSPGAPVATIGDTKRPYAEVFVPIGKLEGIRVGTPASVRVDATSQPFEAEVEHVSRRTEFTPRYLFSDRERPNLVVRVRLRLRDPEQKLHAGVPAFATFRPGP